MSEGAMSDWHRFGNHSSSKLIVDWLLHGIISSYISARYLYTRGAVMSLNWA